MSTSICGKWTQETPFSNMEAILDTVGMTNPQIRAMICSLKPEIEIAKNGDEWEFKMYTTQSTRNVSFTSGQEIDTLSIVGKPVKSVMVVEGNVMKETHRDPNDPSAEVTYITRTFNNDEMVVSLKVKDVEGLSKYKRVA
ncbi:hypothetical protein NP493_111g01022 [Ridgeia piscesae]|uniref:Fatty acid-binding protein n=1 Tax=Ridgeia piscesae TaxID=27915 RepID=A0AAD9UHC9_RIDPI|nr:hypothetical protein NP493_111g01022 [Ridgeia piscesae]